MKLFALIFSMSLSVFASDTPSSCYEIYHPEGFLIMLSMTRNNQHYYVKMTFSSMDAILGFTMELTSSTRRLDCNEDIFETTRDSKPYTKFTFKGMGSRESAFGQLTMEGSEDEPGSKEVFDYLRVDCL